MLCFCYIVYNKYDIVYDSGLVIGMIFRGKKINLDKDNKLFSLKSLMLIFAVLLVFTVIWSLLPSGVISDESEKIKPVKVFQAKEEAAVVELEYLGIVEAEELKKLSFKLSGKLENIYVKEGQSVSKGQNIASLENKEISMALDAARNNMEFAKKSYEFAFDNYEKMIKLQEAGAISFQDLEKARLEMENYRTLFGNSEIDYRNKLNLLEDTFLKADFDGIIADVLYKSGELIPAAYPVAIIRGEGLEIVTGLSQNDFGNIASGDIAYVEIFDKKYKGEVKSINSLPDIATGTYFTKLKIMDDIEDKSVPLGVSAKIFFDAGEEKAIFIPLNIIANDGEEYVYVVGQDNIVQKRKITLGRISNTNVKVFGIRDGELIVSEGFRYLQDGDKVSYQQ